MCKIPTQEQASQILGIDDVKDLQAVFLTETLMVVDNFWGQGRGESLSIEDIVIKRFSMLKWMTPCSGTMDSTN